jgi:hypothetical protein
MKRIDISKFSKEDKLLKVYLGNGTIHHFNSIKSCKKFLAETSEFLTESLYEARAIYIQLWNKYQKSWGYFVNNKKSPKGNLIRSGFTCQEYLNKTSENFDRVIVNCVFDNGNYYSFSQLFSAIAHQKFILKILTEIYRNKSITDEVYECNNLYKRLINLECALKNYSEVKAANIFKINLPSIEEFENDRYHESYPLKKVVA